MKQNQLVRQWIEGKRLSAVSTLYKKRINTSQTELPVTSGLVLVVGKMRKKKRQTHFARKSALKKRHADDASPRTLST